MPSPTEVLEQVIGDFVAGEDTWPESTVQSLVELIGESLAIQGFAVVERKEYLGLKSFYEAEEKKKQLRKETGMRARQAKVDKRKMQ